MADQQDATSADVDTSATEDDDAQAEQLLADAVDSDDGDEESSEQNDDRPLGPKGERALQAEKERRREADRARRAAARERDEALAELERLKKAAEQKPGKTGDAGAADDAGPDLEAIRAEAREKAKAEAKAEILKDRVSDKIEVLAARRFQDAGDAVVHLLRTSEIADFLDGDKIDAEAIKEALDELLEKKPYLAVAAQGGRRFQGSADGGARKGPAGPSQLSEDDLKRMTPEQIVKAHEEGRFNDLLGGSR